MNAAYQMLTQFKAIVTDTAITLSVNTSFAQTKKQSNQDPNQFNKEKWADRECSLCGKKGHPPYPKHCSVAKAFEDNPPIRSEFKETYLSTSDSSSGKSSRRKRTKARKPPKETSSKSKSKSSTKEAIVHLLKTQEKHAKQFAQLVKRLTPPSSKNNSDGSYLSDEDDDHVFTMIETPARNRRSSKKSRSAKNHRSARSSSHSRKHASNRHVTPPPSDSDDDDHSDSLQSDGSFGTTRSETPPDPGPSWVKVVKRCRHGHNQSISFGF
jgi:hypothetical protein